MHENIVDCNVMNLYSVKDPNNIINIKYKNSSAKLYLYQKIQKWIKIDIVFTVINNSLFEGQNFIFY